MFEPRGQHVHSRSVQAIGEIGPYSSCCKRTQNSSIWRDTLLIEDKNILHAHDIVFHAADLSHVSYPARSVGKAGNLNNELDGGRDLTPHRLFGHIEVGYQRHGFNT